MSYLTRLSARVVGARSSSPAIFPKGLKNNQSGVIARTEEPEEEGKVSAMRMPVTRSLRRQEKEEPEEVAAPLRRQEKEEEEENVALLRRQGKEEEGEENVAPLRRQEAAEEEEEVAPLRRQPEEEEEELATLRRQSEEEGEEQEEEDEESIQPMRAIARQEEVPLEENGQDTPPPTQSSLEPGAEPVSQELAGEEEPSTMQALHRDMSSALTPAPQQHATQSAAPDHESVTNLSQDALASSHSMVADLPDGISMANPVFQNTGSDDARPNVTIDQIDVLIQEPALPTSRSESRHNRDRALRARYLRRL